MKDNLYIHDEARKRLISGIRKIADAVGGTMGTGGANSIIEMVENPGHIVTNDGFTIASHIKFADPIEEMGRKILLEAISRANKASGDGSSTTTVLTAAILEEGMKNIENHSPMEIKRSLEACIPFIEKSLDEQKREIDVGNVAGVAAISAEDEEIGTLIQEIYEKIGKKGIIYWDISKTTEDSYTIGSGLTVDGAGYASPYMCDMDEKTGNFLNTAKWKNPAILITKQKITTAGDFETLFKTLNDKGQKEVVIFCDEYEPIVISQLVQTRMGRGFKTMMVKMPVIWKDQWYEDLAKASGATVIDPVAGLTFKTMTTEHLGTFGNITITKDDTFIDGIKDISAHVEALESETDDDSKNRAARLNTKTARLYLGAHSDSALSYKRLKVEDAISAAYHALNGGVVAGGGVALRKVARGLDFTQDIGKKILHTALMAPERQIHKNASAEMKFEKPFSFEGVDTRSGKVVDMFEAQITDPATIVLNAVRNAISVAASVLTANTVVTFPREEEPQSNYPVTR